jgi:hypothetical protein
MGFQYNKAFDLAFDRCLSVFGEEAELFYKFSKYKPSVPIKGLYSSSSMLVDMGNGSQVSNFTPTFEFRMGDFDYPKIGDRLRVRKEFYTISEIQRDASNNIKLILQKRKEGVNVEKK